MPTAPLGQAIPSWKKNDGAPQVGITKTITPDLGYTAGAYTAGKMVGGRIELVNAVRQPGLSSCLVGATFYSKSGQSPEGHLLVFDSDPGTLSDGATVALSTLLSKIQADVFVEAADWVTLGSDSTKVADLPAHKLNKFINSTSSNSTSLWAIFVVTASAPTFTTTSDFGFSLKFAQD